MSQCVKCGARFIGTPENPPKPGLCRYCELDQLRSELATEKAKVKKLRCALMAADLALAGARDTGITRASINKALKETEAK